MGDVDQNQFQTQQTHEADNEAVVKQVDAENTLNAEMWRAEKVA